MNLKKQERKSLQIHLMIIGGVLTALASLVICLAFFMWLSI
ncbi:hypothetical protein SD77_3411 [Bacillus badius]|uniref:Uncharacterized protein n=1 Tax=Bacillus badius TaxID=1455 RepID=A0ABR5ANW1_BACBA|nr:hypothetical protein SD77_3411 [Bacillus badius]